MHDRAAFDHDAAIRVAGGVVDALEFLHLRKARSERDLVVAAAEVEIAGDSGAADGRHVVAAAQIHMSVDGRLDERDGVGLIAQPDAARERRILRDEIDLSAARLDGGARSGDPRAARKRDRAGGGVAPARQFDAAAGAARNGSADGDGEVSAPRGIVCMLGVYSVARPLDVHRRDLNQPAAAGVPCMRIDAVAAAAGDLFGSVHVDDAHDAPILDENAGAAARRHRARGCDVGAFSPRAGVALRPDSIAVAGDLVAVRRLGEGQVPARGGKVEADRRGRRRLRREPHAGGVVHCHVEIRAGRGRAGRGQGLLRTQHAGAGVRSRAAILRAASKRRDGQPERLGSGHPLDAGEYVRGPEGRVRGDSSGDGDDVDGVGRVDGAEFVDHERGDARRQVAADRQRVGRPRREVGVDRDDAAAGEVPRHGAGGCGVVRQIQRPADFERRQGEGCGKIERAAGLHGEILESGDRAKFDVAAGLDGQRVGPRAEIVQRAGRVDDPVNGQRVVAVVEVEGPRRNHRGAGADCEGGGALVAVEYDAVAADRGPALQRDRRDGGTCRVENRDEAPPLRCRQRDLAADADRHGAAAAHRDPLGGAGNRPSDAQADAPGARIDHSAGSGLARDGAAHRDRQRAAARNRCAESVHPASHRAFDVRGGVAAVTVDHNASS